MTVHNAINASNNSDGNNIMLDLISPVCHQFGINYVTYGIYSEKNIKLYCSFQPLLKSWLEDEQSLMPHEITNTTSILDWKQYCSASFLSNTKKQFNYNPNGVTIYFQHRDHAEHIALATNNDIDLTKILLENPDLKNYIVHHIRNSINLNKKDFDVLAHEHSIKNHPSYEITEDDPKTNSKPQRMRHYIYGYRGETYITNAEMQCLLSVLKLNSYKEIAVQMGVSTKTIEAHLGKIKTKLGITSKSQLYRVALNNLLV